jgi:hypothetical protein
LCPLRLEIGQDALANEFGPLPSTDDDEVVTTNVTNEAIALAELLNCTLRNLCQCPEHLVAPFESLMVVVRLEIVDIHVGDV